MYTQYTFNLGNITVLRRRVGFSM